MPLLLRLEVILCVDAIGRRRRRRRGRDARNLLRMVHALPAARRRARIPAWRAPELSHAIGIKRARTQRAPKRDPPLVALVYVLVDIPLEFSANRLEKVQVEHALIPLIR